MTVRPGPAPGIVDAHHHLWDRAHPWMDRPGLAPLRRPHTLDDLRAVTAAAGVTRTVLVQTVGDEDETRAFLAAGEPVAGVVGWVDLTAPDVADRIAALRSGPGGARLVGLRHQVEDEPDTDWVTRPAVVRGLAAVAAAGLVTDLLVRPDQLPAATRAVDAVTAVEPAARFVLDHGAKPPGGPAWSRWATDVAALAARPAVAGKLSGLFTLDPAVVTPSAEHLLAVFGPERLLFGTDWPVSTLALPYPEVVARTTALLSALTPVERAAVLGGTAVRTYALT